MTAAGEDHEPPVAHMDDQRLVVHDQGVGLPRVTMQTLVPTALHDRFDRRVVQPEALQVLGRAARRDPGVE